MFFFSIFVRSASSASCSPKPLFSDAVASVALMLVWIVVVCHIPLLIIGTKWGIDTEVTYIHTNINKHISTQTHTAAIVYTQWTRELESIQLRGRIFLKMYAQDNLALNILCNRLKKRLSCLQLASVLILLHICFCSRFVQSHVSHTSQKHKVYYLSQSTNQCSLHKLHQSENTN